MSGRTMKARLDRLGNPSPKPGAVCRYHGVHCQLGARWPLRYAEYHDAGLIDMIRNAKIRCGHEVGPDPREVWATDRHDRLSRKEVDAQEREMAELIAEAKEVNEEVLRRLLAGERGNSVEQVRQELRDRKVFNQIVREQP